MSKKKHFRQRAHEAFDPIWVSLIEETNLKKRTARNLCYLWLCKRMKIQRDECHIGMMNADQCRQVVNICDEYRIRKLLGRANHRELLSGKIRRRIREQEAINGRMAAY